MSQEALSPFSIPARSLAVGSIYEHYRKNRYKILAIARHSESLEELVIYQALYGEKNVWARPVAMFLENVLIEGIDQPRFKLVQE